MSGLYFSREKELGILKTMGLNAKQTFSLFISQALLLGSVGSLLGLGLGLLFSRLEFFSPETTSADLSYLNTYQSLPFSAWFLGLGIGIIGSFLSAALPSFRAWKNFSRFYIERSHFANFPRKRISFIINRNFFYFHLCNRSLSSFTLEISSYRFNRNRWNSDRFHVMFSLDF
ncbi:efflux ABC transporter, permease protein [Leptospira interrogans serovar Grippotyphosa str. LT2186]|uniref:Efflux ABC transporter, permease protein n=1 Tax=Leptospira interrogans serovar Grippotyphosa str. LT2186 TaxID=1001599 RepID=M3H1E1_LEPIR|nr:efflux ABC transporter, permease protein [Leptospira interrogans serovar Grippotyphosa str. LT2186]